MPLGGGTFTTQNKVLPGSYINFVNVAQAGTALSERGVVALAMPLNWGKDDEIFSVTAKELQEDSLKIFGYSYGADELKGLRDLFRQSKQAYIYKLNNGGAKASGVFARSKYTGIRGNDLAVAIAYNEDSTETSELYDVILYLGGVQVFYQHGVATAAELAENDYVDWITAAELVETAGDVFSGGTNGTLPDASHQTFLDKVESYAFNVLACLSENSTTKGLYANFTKRMRDEVGVKFQCVVHKYAADYEGVISVENGDNTDLVYWAAGAAAGCAVNRSNSNKVYDGEFDVDTNYTQLQLEEALGAGKFIFHKVGSTVRVLDDINTFISVTQDKGENFSNNQVLRVLDQIAKDIAALFNDKYIGQIPNDPSGRVSLWNDIVKHHNELAAIGAIEPFDAATLNIEQGNSKKAVVITDYITPINSMMSLYMTVIVE